jgi:hypothetical protein
MGAEEMTTVATAASAFQAKVIAARLGAEGIVWELRGNVDGMYPLGSIEVRVESDHEEVAREILMVDEVESAFDETDREEPASASPSLAKRVPVLVLLALTVFVIMRVLSLV